MCTVRGQAEVSASASSGHLRRYHLRPSARLRDQAKASVSTRNGCSRCSRCACLHSSWCGHAQPDRGEHEHAQWSLTTRPPHMLARLSALGLACSGGVAELRVPSTHALILGVRRAPQQPRSSTSGHCHTEHLLLLLQHPAGGKTVTRALWGTERAMLLDWLPRQLPKGKAFQSRRRALRPPGAPWKESDEETRAGGALAP